VRLSRARGDWEAGGIPGKGVHLAGVRPLVTSYVDPGRCSLEAAGGRWLAGSRGWHVGNASCTGATRHEMPAVVAVSGHGRWRRPIRKAVWNPQVHPELPGMVVQVTAIFQGCSG